MYIDPAKAQSQSYDYIIIGAGAGGLAAAYNLVRQKFKVLVIESGPSYSASDYSLDKNDWEKVGFPERFNHKAFYHFAPLQKLDPARTHLRSWNHNSGLLSPGEYRRGWQYHHVMGVGGSTLHFTGESHRFHPDYLNKSILKPWPVTYSDLTNYYDQAERIVGVSGDHKRTPFPHSMPYPLPVHPKSPASTALEAGLQKQNLSWQPNPLAILSKPYNGRPGCNYCNNCTKGCPRTDKGSADVTFLAAIKESKNLHVLTKLHCAYIKQNADNTIKSVLAYNHSKAIFEFTADRFILSAGPVHTPRLLLLSQSPQSPEGLCNDFNLVGTNLIETHLWVSNALHPDNVESYKGLPSDSICWDFIKPNSISGARNGCRFTLSVSESDLVGHINYAKRVAKGWGLEHKRQVRESIGRAIGISGLSDTHPNDKSRVTLSKTKRDHFNQPLAEIHSHVSEEDINVLEHMAATNRAVLKSINAEIFEEYGTYDTFTTSQTLGTARMGRTDKDSVVDHLGRSHRWKNLQILDSSILPSGAGGAAPSLTIQALALRAISFK